MNFSKFCLLITICFLISSCSKLEVLRSSIEVLEQSDCDNNKTILKLTAEGGGAPYIYQIKHKIDQKIVYTEVSEENELILALGDLNEVFYELHVIDDELKSMVKDFEVRPTGTSDISDVLHLENQDELFAIEDINVSLYKTEFGHELFMETLTDANGEFSFVEIPSGIYTIEVSLPEKYDSYQLEANQSLNDVIRIRPGSQETIPFIVNCRINLDIDFVYKK